MFELIRQILRYRTFILYSVKSEFKSRFARSKLGFLWVVLHPLAQVLIYALVLSNILSAKLPGINNKYSYAIYLLAGMIAWTIFTEIMSRCVMIFVDNGNLMKKLVFPKIVLPIIVMGSAIVNTTILFVCSVVIFLILGFVPGYNIFWLPILFIVTIVFSLSIGLFLGVLNVFIRDISQIVPIVLQFWFWFTPIVYMKSIIPEKLSVLINFNPMFPIVASFQNVILMNTPPMFKQLSVLLFCSMLILIIGLFLYKKAAPEMVDVV